MRRHYFLTPVLGGPGAPRYPVADEPRLIGRSERAAIALLEPTVSREHATIEYRDGAVYLEDLGSKHGTFVNSKRVASVKLKVGDIIVFGLSLVLRLEESEAPVPMVPTSHAPETPARTVSAFEPLPEERHAETQITSFEAIRRSAKKGSEDFERVLDQLAKLRKLAGAGAMCAAMLPDLHHQLALTIELIAHEDEITPGGILEALRQLHDELSAVLRAIHVPAPRLAPTSLFEALHQAVAAVKPLAAPRKVDLLIGVPPDLQVIADPPRLEAAFVELLRNAAEASPEGQPVEIAAEVRTRSATVTITDRGAGVPEDLQDRLFSPLFTLRRDRTAVGLGLFEARQLVLSFGGRVGLDSAPGRTTVSVVLRIP